MNYTLHQLMIFKKVAELGSITKAADAMYLTQPAISLQLKKFQEEFEYPLTELIGRKLYLTDFGQEVLSYTHKILEESAAIEHIAALRSGRLFGKLRIAIVSTGIYIMPFYLSDFLKKNTDVELFMDVTNKAQVIESLSKNRADFALVSLLPEDLAVKSIELMDNKLFLVSHPDNELSGLSLSEILEKSPLIFREKGSGTRLTIERYLKEKNLNPKKSIELTSNEAVKQAVMAGLGISIMPAIGIKQELKSGLLNIIQLEELPINTKWQLIWLQQKELSPLHAAFIETIKQNKDEISHRLLQMNYFKNP